MNKDYLDFLFEYIDKHTAWCMHQEEQRTKVNSLLFFICSIFIAFSSADDNFNLHDIPVAVFIISLGIFGVFFNIKFHERFDSHNCLINVCLDEVSKEIPKLDISEIKKKARDLSIYKTSPLRKIGLYFFWVVLNCTIIVLGVLFLGFAIIGVEHV